MCVSYCRKYNNKKENTDTQSVCIIWFLRRGRNTVSPTSGGPATLAIIHRKTTEKCWQNKLSAFETRSEPQSLLLRADPLFHRPFFSEGYQPDDWEDPQLLPSQLLEVQLSRFQGVMVSFSGAFP